VITTSFEHGFLTCSNVLLGLNGSVKIDLNVHLTVSKNITDDKFTAGLKFCVKNLSNQPQNQFIKALTFITMKLMQKYEKNNKLIEINDLNRWPVDSDAVEFLSATSSTVFIKILKQVILVQPVS
jgi:hypothetical protein